VNGRNVAFYSDTTQIVIDISTQDYQTNLKWGTWWKKR
jgi:hypothetical protein